MIRAAPRMTAASWSGRAKRIHHPALALGKSRVVVGLLLRLACEVRPVMLRRRDMRPKRLSGAGVLSLAMCQPRHLPRGRTDQHVAEEV